ncbi:MAG: hypothetical protein FJ387_30620 [Verrucomicrobia bacterium]|nr:hypothetical protein [Verrucomicrobiota bacterium]
MGRFPEPGDEELLAGPSRNFQVFDPLDFLAEVTCPKCGPTMRIVAFIERHQNEVIEKILRHCGLWEDQAARAPPSPAVAVEDGG